MKNVISIIVFLYTVAGFCFMQKPATSFLSGIQSVYVHIDKNSYTPGETLWFKAYFTDASQPVNQTLLVKIIDTEHKNVLIEKEFPVYDIRSHGQIVLPDSIATGTYQLVAYGNATCNLNKYNVFVQQIKILKNTASSLIAKAQLLNTGALLPGKPVQIKFNLTKNSYPVKGIKGKFTASYEGQDKILSSDKLKTDTDGIAIASFIYPQAGPYDHVLVKGEFYDGDKQIHTELFLPSTEKKLLSDIYVEGGQLINGLKNKVLISLKDENNIAVANATIVLREDKANLSSAKTDSTGRAALQFVPKNNMIYDIMVTGDAINKPEILQLPDNKEGILLKLINDRNIKVINTGAATQRKLELWNEAGVLVTKELNIKAGDSVSVVLPQVNEKTIISAGLFKDNKLTNERVFMQGSTDFYTVKITVDNKNIKPHQKVTARVHIEDASGNSVKANLSVATVFNKVIDKEAYKIISLSAYNGMASDKEIKSLLQQDIATANKLLIAKKWRQDTLIMSNENCTASAGLTGFLKNKKKNRGIHINQFIMHTSQGSKIIKVEKNGSFTIPPEYLLAKEGQENYINIDDLLQDYTIEIDSKEDGLPSLLPLVLANKKINYSIISEDIALLPISGVVDLEGVTITKKRDNEYTTADYQKWVRDFPAVCNDYVCIHGIINCGVHKMEKGPPPVVGHRYFYNIWSNYLYTHCISCDCKEKAQTTFALKSITLPEPFPDLTFEGDFDLKYYSTIYWNPNINTNAGGDATVNFTTSDLSGAYTIIIQGLTDYNNSAVYGSTEFKVLLNQ